MRTTVSFEPIRVVESVPVCVSVYPLVIETGSVPIAILRHRAPHLVSGVRIVALLNKFCLLAAPANQTRRAA
jgi:hypothetical protein